MQKVRVAGAGMTRFGKYPGRDLRDLAEEAVHNTVKDAGIDLKEIEAAYAGNSQAHPQHFILAGYLLRLACMTVSWRWV